MFSYCPSYSADSNRAAGADRISQ